MPQIDTRIVKPRVLDNTYPVYDRAGNKLQRIRVLYACNHEDEWYSLDLGKGWKPRSARQIMNDELRITCPMAWKVCQHCAGGQQ